MSFPWVLFLTSSIGMILLGYSISGFRYRRGWIASLVLGLILMSTPLVSFELEPTPLFWVFFVCVLMGLGPALLWWAFIFWRQQKRNLAFVFIFIAAVLMGLVFGFGPDFLQSLINGVESHPGEVGRTQGISAPALA